MRKVICIYHKDCLDGFASAYIVHKYFTSIGRGNDIEYFDAKYGDDRPIVEDAQVIILDFSFKRDILLSIAQEAEDVLILDHHITAMRDLIDLPKNVEALFDISRCGAMIAWGKFFPRKKPPKILEYIQDYDLWELHNPDTKEVIAGLNSYPREFHIWDSVFYKRPRDFVSKGDAILRYEAKIIKRIIDNVFYEKICGHLVPLVNAPLEFVNELGNILCKNKPFAVVFHYTNDAIKVSLRSDADSGVDVSKIAEQYGGGGHEHSAGFLINSLEECLS